MYVPLPAFPTAAACQAFLSPSLCPPSVGPRPYMLPRWHTDMAARQHGRMSVVFECFLAVAWKTNIFFILFFCKRTATHTLLFRSVWKAVLWNILAPFCKVWSGSSWKTMDISSQDSTLILVQSFSSGPWYSGTDFPSPCGAEAYLYTDTLHCSIVIKSWILCIFLLWRWMLLYYCRTHLCGHLHSRWLRN